MIPNFNNNGPCFELFSSAAEIIKYWKFRGKYSKEFEPHSKSNIYYLHFGGVSNMSTPIDEKHSLQINNSCLLFQFMLFNTKSFSIEICVRDKTDTKRRFNLTSSVKEVESKSLYIKIPFIDYPMYIWTNLIVDLNSLIQQYFKMQTFKTIDSIHITGNLKIRKIFSLRTKDEPILKTIDMGKSVPSVNLLFTEKGNILNTNIKIIGINNTHINTVNIDSKSIQNKSNINNNNNKKRSPSPFIDNSTHNNKYSTASDITPNKFKQIYTKKNNVQHGSKTNINNIKKESITNKINENKKFIQNLPDITKLTNNIKYKKGKTVIKKIAGSSNEEGNNSNNIININNINNINNNEMKNNFVEKNKSLGKYIQNQKNNKKRNKSNNPYIRPKMNKKSENSEIKEKKFEKKFENLNININANTNTKVPNKNSPSNKKINQKDNNEIIIDNYHQSKEKEIILEDYNSPDSKAENKFKFNSIPLGNSLLYKNQNKPKEEEKEIFIDKKPSNNSISFNNNNPNNKFSNTNMLLESGIDIKNIPIYDSIEEVAEWQGQGGNDWNNIQGEGVGNKLIRLDSIKKVEKVNNNIDDDDLLEFGSLERKENYRPYTPPIEELVQVNPNRMKGDSNMKMSLDKKSTLKSNKTLKNYENLVYIEEKGLLYDPLTNKYYDIKAK